jgi:hypothetical protein
MVGVQSPYAKCSLMPSGLGKECKAVVGGGVDPLWDEALHGSKISLPVDAEERVLKVR